MQAGLLEQFLSKVLREASGLQESAHGGYELLDVIVCRTCDCSSESLNEYPAWHCLGLLHCLDQVRGEDPQISVLDLGCGRPAAPRHVSKNPLSEQNLLMLVSYCTRYPRQGRRCEKARQLRPAPLENAGED